MDSPNAKCTLLCGSFSAYSQALLFEVGDFFSLMSNYALPNSKKLSNLYSFLCYKFLNKLITYSTSTFISSAICLIV